MYKAFWYIDLICAKNPCELDFTFEILRVYVIKSPSKMLAANACRITYINNTAEITVSANVRSNIAAVR